jgi:dUTP pyrophosphatase
MHLVAFHSRKFSPAECNYDIHDKEMLAIIEALKSWCHYCLGANNTIEILIDHQNLRYFTSTKTLNQRQARWAETLSQFDFIIKYRPGVAGGKPDALSRRSEYAKGEGEVHTALLKPGQLQISALKVQTLSISKLDERATIPGRESEHAAGVDLHSIVNLTIGAGERCLIKTGLAAAAPPDTYIRIAPRSGLAKRGIDVGAGVVDADYRGEIQALLINNSAQPFTIQIGDRIAQLILERIVRAEPTSEASLTNTIRGDQGFGSTGIASLLSAANISTLKTTQFHQDFLNQVRITSLADPAYQDLVSHPDPKSEVAAQDGLIYF